MFVQGGKYVKAQGKVEWRPIKKGGVNFYLRFLLAMSVSYVTMFGYRISSKLDYLPWSFKNICPFHPCDVCMSVEKFWQLFLHLFFFRQVQEPAGENLLINCAGNFRAGLASFAFNRFCVFRLKIGCLNLWLLDNCRLKNKTKYLKFIWS